jgi:hypothetical protein
VRTLCARIARWAWGNRILVSGLRRRLRVLLGRDLELVISASYQVIIAGSYADIRPWETQVYSLGLARSQPVWVKLVRAPLIAHAEAGKVWVRPELNKRAFHLAPIAYCDGD